MLFLSVSHHCSLALAGGGLCVKGTSQPAKVLQVLVTKVRKLIHQAVPYKNRKRLVSPSTRHKQLCIINEAFYYVIFLFCQTAQTPLSKLSSLTSFPHLVYQC